MSNDLLPCPFCGGTAKLRQVQCCEDSVDSYVECGTCDARTGGIEAPFGEPELAACEWNRRAPTVGGAQHG